MSVRLKAASIVRLRSDTTTMVRIERHTTT